MSIVGLASDKVLRNPARVLPPVPSTASSDQTTLTDALAAVAAYVPTEILTAYMLTLAIGSSGQSLSAYVVFLAMTPLFVWLVFAAKSREENRAFLPWRLWPWWECAAACVAFTAWSAALPQTAFQRFGWYSPGAAGVVLTLTSGLLPLIGTVLTKPKT